MAHRSKGFTHGEPPATARYLIVQLKPGWTADFEANAFVHGKEWFALEEVLEVKASLQPHVASLTEKSSRKLSEAERELARFVQVRISSARQMTRVMQLLAKFDGVAQVALSAEVSLPDSSA